MNEFRGYSFAYKSDELRRLMNENPELPIAVLAGQDSITDCHCWTFCSCVSFSIEEILDCDYVDCDDTVFTDRDRLEEYICDMMCDEYEDKSEEEFNNAVKNKLEELEPYWTKVIAIYADN